MISNKVLVTFFAESNDSQSNGEVSTSWTPINFPVYHEMFPELIQEAIDEWLADNTIQPMVVYEVIFKHVIERDSGGAVLGEYFEPIVQEMGEF